MNDQTIILGLEQFCVLFVNKKTDRLLYVKIIAVFMKFCIYVACLHEDSHLNSTMNFQMHKK